MLLPTPPDENISTMQKSIFLFVWKGKRDRISRKNAIRSIEEGGLGIPDIRMHIAALKLTWLRKFNRSNHKWKNIINTVYPKMKHIDKLGTGLYINPNVNCFWRDVFSSYKEFGSKVTPVTSEEFLAEPIFSNQNITVGRKMIFHRNWIEQGVFVVGQLLDINGNVLNFDSFKTKFHVQTDFMTYSGCLRAIKTYAKKFNITVQSNNAIVESIVWRKIVSVYKGAKIYYNILTENKSSLKYCKKWNEKLGEEVNWKPVFIKLKCVKETKLKWFQIRLTQRIIATNITLSEMKIENDNLCTFCRILRESIEHLFWECPHVQLFWTSFQTLLNSVCVLAGSVTMSKPLVLFGCKKNFKVTKVLILLC